MRSIIFQYFRGVIPTKRIFFQQQFQKYNYFLCSSKDEKVTRELVTYSTSASVGCEGRDKWMAEEREKGASLGSREAAEQLWNSQKTFYKTSSPSNGPSHYKCHIATDVVRNALPWNFREFKQKRESKQEEAGRVSEKERVGPPIVLLQGKFHFGLAWPAQSKAELLFWSQRRLWATWWVTLYVVSSIERRSVQATPRCRMAITAVTMM